MDNDSYIGRVREAAMRVAAQLKTPFDKEDFKETFRVSFHDRLPALKYLGCKSVDQFILGLPNIYKSVVDGEFFYLPPGSQQTPDHVRLTLLSEKRERLLKLQAICLELARDFGQPFAFEQFKDYFYSSRMGPANFPIRKFGIKTLEELLQTVPQLARTGDGKYIIIEENSEEAVPEVRDPLEDHRGIVAAQNGTMRPFADPVIGHNDSGINEEGEEVERKVDVRVSVENPVPPVAGEIRGAPSGSPNEEEAGNEEVERKVNASIRVEHPPPMAEELGGVAPPQVVEGVARTSRGYLDVRAFLERGGGASPRQSNKRRQEMVSWMIAHGTGGAPVDGAPSAVNLNVKVEPPAPGTEEEIVIVNEVAPPAKRAHPENAETPDRKPLIPPAASINSNAPPNVGMESTSAVSDDVLPDQMHMGSNNGAGVPMSPAGFFFSPSVLQQPASNGPSSKHEAFGCFVACCLDEAEKKGKDIGDLTAKIIATLHEA